MIEKGLVYGRFQILHLKHVEYILAAKMRCKRLYIGIAMSDDLHVSGGEEDNYRVRRSANPLTYIERFEKLGIPVEVLWRRTKEEKGVSGSQIRQRILADEKWDDLVPKTVYDYVLSHGIDDRIKFSK